MFVDIGTGLSTGLAGYNEGKKTPLPNKAHAPTNRLRQLQIAQTT
jgi:hypothetical protein